MGQSYRKHYSKVSKYEVNLHKVSHKRVDQNSLHPFSLKVICEHTYSLIYSDFFYSDHRNQYLMSL